MKIQDTHLEFVLLSKFVFVFEQGTCKWSLIPKMTNFSENKIIDITIKLLTSLFYSTYSIIFTENKSLMFFSKSWVYLNTEFCYFKGRNFCTNKLPHFPGKCQIFLNLQRFLQSENVYSCKKWGIIICKSLFSQKSSFARFL